MIAQSGTKNLLYQTVLIQAKAAQPKYFLSMGMLKMCLRDGHKGVNVGFILMIFVPFITIGKIMIKFTLK